MGDININYSYPKNQYYDYYTQLNRIDLDAEMKKDIANNRGFRIKQPQPIKKELKNEDGIYSSRFGATMQDVNAYSDRYKCACGFTKERINNKTICPKCGTEVKYIDDDFTYFGWIVLDEYFVINPALYKSINFLIGEKRLQSILELQEDVDQDGNPIERTFTKEEPFKGIGMIEFHDRFDEILEFYRKKTPNKEMYYNDIMKERNKVFTHSIPVYTTYLRPFNVDGENFAFEGTNALFNMMSVYAHRINKTSTRLYKQKRPKDKLLYKLQCKWMELYDEVETIISGKAGVIRKLFGGRYNWASRSVIVPNNDLRIDEITLPYKCLLEWLQFTIINVIQTFYNRGYDEAYRMWYNASISEKADPFILNIIKSIIKDPNKYGGRGIPVLLNRNPTISFGSILQMFVVDVNDNYTMGIPLQILNPLAADFDGDVLNVLYIINDNFFNLSNRIFNPRNSFYISHNDGKFNSDVNHSKDTLINLSTFKGLGESSYSQNDLDKINKILASRTTA